MFDHITQFFTSSILAPSEVANEQIFKSGHDTGLNSSTASLENAKLNEEKSVEF